MKIAGIGCIHNDLENLMQLLDKVFENKPDVFALVGDWTDANLPEGFSHEDIGKIIVSELRGYGKPIVAVPGSWDKGLIDFLKKEDVSVHADGKIINGVGFYGFGGAKTPFGTPFEPEESEIEIGLRSGYEVVKNAKVKVQLTHTPPAKTSLDMVFSGNHVGSEAVRKFIEEKKPLVAICAHIHEGTGIDHLNETWVINVGKFTEGQFGLIDIDGGKARVKIVNLM